MPGRTPSRKKESPKKSAKRPRSRSSRRATDTALAASEARFRALTELSSDWYWEQDAEYRFTRFSPSHTAKGRIEEKDLLGKRRWEVPAIRLSQQAWAAHHADLAARRSFRGLEYLVTTKSGELLWFSASGEPMVDADGTFTGYRGVVRDVTERKHAEEALKHSEARFRSLADLSSDWYWEQDAELRFVSTGGRNSGRGGITADDHTGRTRWELPGTEILGQTWAQHQAVLAARQPFRDVLLRRTVADGAVFHISVTGEPTFDAGGAFTGYRGISRDVTERRRADLAIAASEARFRDFAQASAEWFWETDAQGRYTWLSDAFETASGMKVADRIGLNRIEQISAGADLSQEPWASHVATLARHAPFRDFRARRRWPGGESWVSASGVPRFSESGEFLGYRGSSNNITERVLAERRARVAEDRLRAAVEDLNEGFCLCDAEDRIVFANRHFREANPGLEEYLAPGRRYEDHERAGLARGYYPEAAGREEQWLAQRRALRLASSGPLERQRQDGIWLLVSEQRLPDGGCVTFGLDITERKKAELALVESGHRFRDFAEAGLDWFWETDAEGRYVWFSDSVERIGGAKPEWHYGKKRIDLAAAHYDLSVEPWKSHLEKLERHEQFRDFRYERAGPSGSNWLSVSGTPYFDHAGRFAGYRGSGNDITEKVSAEHKALAARELLRSALENLGEMICLTDADDRIVLANRHFIEFNAQVAEYMAPGRRYDEHLRAGVARGLFPDAAGREEEWIAERMAFRRNPQGPAERRRQDGRWLMVDDQVLPDGSIITYGIEITGRKRAEESLRDINADLERRVASRTAALQAAYSELESFSYSVSHDLRSPLGVIASFAGILAKQESGRISEDGRRLVSVIDDNAQRMGRLIDALLELMRMSRRALVFRQLDMDKIAGTTCRELQREYPKAELGIGALPAARGDETLIQQVYANLVGNAFKFSAKIASPRVELGAETIDGSTVYYVRDNGAGFHTEHAAKLFKPFERLHSEQEFSGTGIGLALVQLIVQRHGGRIWAESAPGRGSTFRFTLAQAGSGTLAGGDSG